MATTRKVTRAQRNFGSDELAKLGRNDVREICHALLMAQAFTFEGFRSFPDYDEYVLVSKRMWRMSRTILRIYDRAVDQADVDELRSLLEDEAAGDGLILCPRGVDARALSYPNVSLVSATDIAREIERSTLVYWTDGTPSLARSRLQHLLALPEMARLVDPAGIAWLPALALNELPSDLNDLDVEPQDLLERKTFRILTGIVGFGGVRYGESRRGERVPDAVLTYPAGPEAVVMLDCKAASSGYHMIADHLLRFEEYHDSLSPEWATQGRSFTHLLIVSSHFSDPKDDRRAFLGRSAELQERTGMRLTYLCAADLAWFANSLESRDVSLDKRAGIDWSQVLDQGIVTAASLDEVIEGVS
ncbi:MAG: hypothetical protein K8R99_08185 [Actinomycetia bacterium]|nr:hypothetical protein [Actinomycetes bacterium]